MAFGFGFNKQKVLSAAEKCVQQGRLQNAITEYEKILKNDPKELTVLNTVGDLYARLGNTDKAVECFKSVGDAYASQGFTVKAIAMYKKLSKLKTSLETVLRLAELYTQQGLFNDARAQYLMVADEFLRAGELDQAVRIFQKTLEMDPENVSMRTKLAEVYIRLNKKTEAWQIFSAAAETLRSKGQLNAAEEILQRMLTLDPNNSYALLLRGRTAFEGGDTASAIQFLEKVADLDSHPDGLRTLLQAYLQGGRVAEAGSLAGKLLSVHNDVAAMLNYAEGLIAAGQFENALRIYREHSERLLAADSGKVLETLHSLIGHVAENTTALEMLLELLNKASDTTHLTEVYELLAHAYVQSGELATARNYYLKLTQLEPENQLHARNYQQVLNRLGTPSSARLITAEEGAVMVDELEATAPFIDQRYADNVAIGVRAALTDAELFVSYNMPAKALGPLLSALPQAPHDLRINQRLAALHTKAGRFTEAAVCCRTLESIYHDAGHPEEASRYGELAAKYEERAASAPMPASASALPVAEVPATVSETKSAIREFAVSAPIEPVETETVEATPAAEEIDLSAEWEGAESATPAEPAATAKASPSSDDAIAEAKEEIRFYLANKMVQEAQAAFNKLKQLGKKVPGLSELRAELQAATTKSAPAVEEEVSVEAVDNHITPAAEEPVAPEPVSAKSAPPAESWPAAAKTKKSVPPPAATVPVAAAGASRPADVSLNSFVSDLEASLGDSFPVAPPIEAHAPKTATRVAKTAPQATDADVPTAKQSAAMAAAAGAPSSAPGFSPAFTYQPTPTQPLPPSTSAPAKEGGDAGVDLAGMFGDLKQELEEEVTTTADDPETHYNLGVAFREMGLLDEAISELQKVCTAIDRGHAFSFTMQTYTWLAQCFLDKNVPEAAIRWYEKALKLPGLDEETRTALNYELASAHEAAGNRPLALNHFMEVYGNNIDYRDVAERIKSLKS
jgi:tetratricopeptide (TPR) repeat protein